MTQTAPPAQATQDPLAAVLERIRNAADNIGNADTPDEMARINEQAKTTIVEAISELTPITVLLRNLSRYANSIGTAPGNDNQDPQSSILLTLEALAFGLEQDDWAISHGFKNPQKIAV